MLHPGVRVLEALLKGIDGTEASRPPEGIGRMDPDLLLLARVEEPARKWLRRMLDARPPTDDSATATVSARRRVPVP